jgi:hypothetical protein
MKSLTLWYTAQVATINFAFKFVVKKLVKYMHFDTKSAESNANTMAIFLLTFFNSTVLLLLLNANFSETKLPFIADLFTAGKREDWDSKWYLTVGPTII